MKITKLIAQKVVSIVKAGLVSGVGNPVPGEMCVEAAVCFALGLPHGDDPPCVGSAVRSAKIALNDAEWSTNEARAKGMLRIAVAQLGSNEIDQAEFSRRLAEKTIRQILPVTLRRLKTPTCDEAATRCENEGSEAAAWAAAQSAAEEADLPLVLFAQIILDVLTEMEAPGIQWLPLCD